MPAQRSSGGRELEVLIRCVSGATQRVLVACPDTGPTRRDAGVSLLKTAAEAVLFAVVNRSAPVFFNRADVRPHVKALWVIVSTTWR
jgi:hypothetical protein